ncbi:MAG: SIR2 family protein [Nitrososphaera sp.]
MKITLFLGAGASTPFGKPTTVQLKDKLSKEFPFSLEMPFLPRFFDHKEYPDIEYILQSVKDIRNFLDSYGGKFFSHAGFGLHFQTNHGQIPFVNFVKDIKKIQDVLEEKIFENYSWRHTEDNNLSYIYDEIFSFIRKYSDQMIVITTNYDRAIEEYCENQNKQIRCIDGFQLSGSRFLWAKGDYGYAGNNNNGNDLFLYKLHGSLNWKKHEKYDIERTTEEWKPKDPNYEENMLVYPTLSPKDGYEKEPYKSIRDNFVKMMDISDLCIVIGFSFRDIHINDIFLKFLKNGKTIIVISPDAWISYNTNLLNVHLTEKEILQFRDAPITREQIKIDGVECGHILTIQKKVEVRTIKEIMHDVKRLIEPEKHPF